MPSQPIKTPPLMALDTAIAWTPVTHNTDWKPLQQSFEGIPFVLVPVGCFMMGSTDGYDSMPVHEQCFDVPFWISQTEVTQADYVRLSGQANPSIFQEFNHPVENITWLEAMSFATAHGFRLPTEREWEYAARGPDNLIYPWGNAFLADALVFNRNSGRQSAPVGSKPSGASWVGALDMSGNVWEWVSSEYAPYPYNATDGRENWADETVLRLLRGGAWGKLYTFYFRTDYRGWEFPIYRDDEWGFRLVKDGVE